MLSNTNITNRPVETKNPDLPTNSKEKNLHLPAIYEEEKEEEYDYFGRREGDEADLEIPKA